MQLEMKTQCEKCGNVLPVTGQLTSVHTNVLTAMHARKTRSRFVHIAGRADPAAAEEFVDGAAGKARNRHPYVEIAARLAAEFCGVGAGRAGGRAFHYEYDRSMGGSLFRQRSGTRAGAILT